jgi:hypothetical protein
MTFNFFFELQLYAPSNVYVLYYTNRDGSTLDLYTMTLSMSLALARDG